MIELADGSDVAVERREVCGPPWRCPQCDQIRAMGHRRGDSLGCGNRGLLGEDLPEVGVAVDADGRGRLFTGRRRGGEAVHRLHLERCAAGLLAA